MQLKWQNLAPECLFKKYLIYTIIEWKKVKKDACIIGAMYPKLFEILGQIAPIMEAFSKGLKITNIKYTL